MCIHIEVIYMKRTKIFKFAAVCSISFACLGGAIGAFLSEQGVKEARAQVSSFYDKLFIGETELTSGGTIDDGQGGSVTFTLGSGKNPHTLTFDNFHYTGVGLDHYYSANHHYIGVAYGIDRSLNVVCKGESEITLTSSSNAESYVAFYLNPHNISKDYIANFTGDGTLKCKAPNDSVYSSYGGLMRMRFKNTSANLEFEGSNVATGSNGVKFEGGFELVGGSLKGTGDCYGIYCNAASNYSAPGYRISGGTVTAIGGMGGPSNAAIGFHIASLSSVNSFEMTGGTINATAQKDKEYSYGFEYGWFESENSLRGGVINASGKFGIYRGNSNPDTYPYDRLVLSDDIIINAQGSEKALNCIVINSIPGKAYSQEGFTGDETPLAVSSDAVDYRTSTYKSARFEKEDATYITRPTAKELVYNGEEQFLVNDGEASHGEIVYRLEGEEDFTYDVPKATEVGTYKVEYKIEGDPGYRDTEISTLDVTISAKPAPGPTPTPGGSSKAGLPAGAVVGIVLGSIVLALGGAYALLFFVFNKWIKEGDKAVRVLRFVLGKKDGKGRYLAFPCRFAYRNKEEVFLAKSDALK